jgi:DUF1365 family protein
VTARLYRGTMSHVRTGPVRHAFSYPAAFVAIDLTTLARFDRGSRRFGYNRPALLRIDDRDYLDPGDSPISAKLAAWMPGFDHRHTMILSSPRSLLRSFNPLAGYFAYAAGGGLAGFAAEVANPHGERYFYNLQPQLRPDGGFTAETPKAMYVSPFHGVKGRYRFTGFLDPDRADLSVDLEVEGRVVIAARLSGVGSDLQTASAFDLVRVATYGALAWPRIVCQALILRAKGLKPVMKPRPPADALRGRRSNR